MRLCSARCSGRARSRRWATVTRPRWSRRCTSSRARSSSAPPAQLDGGRARVRLLACARAGRLLRADPAAARAARHQAAAAWLEDKAGERVEDLADVLAYHYESALELSGPPAATSTSELQAHAVRYLAWPARGRSRSTSIAPSGNSRRPSSSLPRAIRRAPRCSSAGARRPAAGPTGEARDVLGEALVLYREQNERWQGALSPASATCCNGSETPRRGDASPRRSSCSRRNPPGPELVSAHTYWPGGTR